MSGVLEQVRHRLTTTDYHRMGVAGVFGATDRVELIGGEIIDMAPIGSAHSGVVALLTNRLVLVVASAAIVSVQNPVVLGVHSEPQPDVSVLRPRQDFYRSSHPTPADMVLLIEVAETSLELDREIKVPLYARHDVPEVWLIDLQHSVLTIYRSPIEGVYRESLQPRDLSQIAPAQLPQATLDLSDLFHF